MRDGEVRNVFRGRRGAVKCLKELLEQILKDLKKQDKTDEYDCPIKITDIEIRPVELKDLS